MSDKTAGNIHEALPKDSHVIRMREQQNFRYKRQLDRCRSGKFEVKKPTLWDACSTRVQKGGGCLMR